MPSIKLLSLRTILSLVLGSLVWLSAIPAHADQFIPTPPVFLPPAWYVTGALLIVGNDACSGLPCTETIAFSFDLGYEFSPATPTYRAYISNVTDTWSGALGSFSLTSAGPEGVNAAKDVFGFFDPLGEEIDIDILQGFVSKPPTTPLLGGADLWSCWTTTCVTDFAPSFFQGGTLPKLGILVGGPAEFTVTPIATTPEPATLALLLSGLFVVGLMEFTQRKIRLPKRLNTPLS